LDLASAVGVGKGAGKICGEKKRNRGGETDRKTRWFSSVPAFSGLRVKVSFLVTAEVSKRMWSNRRGKGRVHGLDAGIITIY